MSITLKAARVNQNLTQEEAAKRLGVQKETVSNWERGKSFPSTKLIPKITELYKVNYDDLNFLPSHIGLTE